MVLVFASTCIAQNAGDYRTNTGAAVAQWTSAAIWQVYDGVAWQPAVSYPTSTSGQISITAGDSIQLTGASFTIDQVNIESTASLLIFSSNTTLNNVASEDDINVDGRLYIASGGLVTTSTGATINVNSGGYMQIRNGGILSANTTNLGEMELNLSTLTNVTITNNGVLRFIATFPTASNYNVSMNNGSIVNNGDIEVTAVNNVLFSGVSGTNTITNSIGATVIKLSTGGIFGTNNSGTGVAFTNNGDVGGVGTISFGAVPSTIVNNGTLAPGLPIGIQSISSNSINGGSATIEIEILNGTGAGTGNDRLDITGATNLAGNTLTVIETGSVPLGTYTIMTTTGTFTNSFATVNLPPQYGNLVVGSNTITVDKIGFTLPVVWGNLKAALVNKQVLISWETITEINTSHFVVEHSQDGRNFRNIGSVNGNVNSSETNRYNFLHSTPHFSGANYYRIKEIALDGKAMYSAIISIKLDSDIVKAVKIESNIIKNELKMIINQEGLLLNLYSSNGSLLNNYKLPVGLHYINLQKFRPGVYYLEVVENGKQQIVEKIIKQ